MMGKLTGIARILGPALAAGGLGAVAGSKLKAKQVHGKVREAQQASDLAKKLREVSESANRRLRIENYYIRRALNQLARKRVEELKGSK
jgi:hypothetical protein